MDKKMLVISTIITIVVVGVVGFGLSQQISTSNVNLTQQLSNINYKIDQLYDNKGLTQTIYTLRDSVVEILVPITPSNKANFIQTTELYVDNNGNVWGSGGAGFVIRSDGYILTAKHVIENSPTILVVLSNSTKLSAQIITSNIFFGNEDLDMAIIKVNYNLTPVELGTSDSYDVGSNVAFIGYPFFSSAQVTHEGIISFKGLRNNKPTITVNSFVNSGNSGSPVFLVNSGKVIGIINGRENLAGIQTANIPSNISYEFQLVLQTQNNIINAMNQNIQSGVGIATPVDSGILNNLPPKA
ncbi:MAG: trypsin-like peptidase domain-containing protein [Candidatus Aenigmarchaeota archaeon]|nr:trypsin-like peptidase domain-containing protein [Candidatus Aenigmarchaeota archaeon]